MESWSDLLAYACTYSVVQPLIEPLHGGRSWIELIALLLGDPAPDARQLVRDTFRTIAGSRYSERLWRKTLHDGLLADSSWTELKLPEPKAVELPVKPPPTRLNALFLPDYSVYDGRFANNSWLQECPDPITKLTWDNAALLSLPTAKELGVQNEQVVRLSVDGKSVELPVCIVPGIAPRTIVLHLGYGRQAAGSVGGDLERDIEPVGANVYQLRTSQNKWFAQCTVHPTRRIYKLATTQDHFVIDRVGFKERQERVGALVRSATLEQYRRHPDFAQHVTHVPPLRSLWHEHSYEGHRWGMAIDLSKCIGCNACVLACQAENNVPVVGKEQVLRGREMHWIRIDRYFRGNPNSDQIEVALQPVACQQCELAPCEQVCPVGATVHSHEGLNDMVYNRCIGTRYCANNCPYKVRRFNYFNYHKNIASGDQSLLQLLFNPQVTVRSRGVMEKCTYCIQRIQAAKIAAGNERRPIQDGEIQTACQQACPTEAIIFGDLADSDARVAQLHAEPRAYAMLAELNVKPRTVYLAKVQNPHPDLLPNNERDHSTT